MGFSEAWLNFTINKFISKSYENPKKKLEEYKMIRLTVNFPKMNIFLWRTVSIAKFNNILATFSASMCLGKIIYCLNPWQRFNWLKYILLKRNVYLPKTSNQTDSTSVRKTKKTLTNSNVNKPLINDCL